MSSSFSSIMDNLTPSLLELQKLVSGAAYLLGVHFLIKGIMALKHAGEGRSHMGQQHSLKEPILYLTSGAMLIYLPTAMDIILKTVYGSNDILSYNALEAGNPIIDALFGSSGIFGGDLVIFIQLIGLIAFVRGWVILAKSSSQQGGHQASFGKAVMHIFGGILAINIVQTINIVNNTLYGY
jgi:intracellular multiplication protein IcmC